MKKLQGPRVWTVTLDIRTPWAIMRQIKAIEGRQGFSSIPYRVSGRPL